MNKQITYNLQLLKSIACQLLELFEKNAYIFIFKSVS